MKNKLFKEAESLFEKNKLEEAEKLFNKIVENDPNNDEAFYYLGRIKNKFQNFGQAINYFNKALEISPDNEKVKHAIISVNNILNISNSLYYENPYTDDDLYE
ncbi:MAG: tetratricopeptide repeat protein [Bacteroidetes bacterium]|nr:tetratricopeptide repeat protein [Bacteroidota bacterium]